MRLIVTMAIIAAAAGGCQRVESAADAASRTEAPPLPAVAESVNSPAGKPAATDRTIEPAGNSAATVREIVIPTGTTLPIVLDTAVGSDISRIEQAVHAHLSRVVVVRGRTVLPQGSTLSGVVTDARRSGKVKGLAHVAVRFDTLVPKGDDERYRIRTATVGRTAPSTKKRDAAEIGAPAVGGAIVGGVIGGKKGAAIGAAAGGGAGTAVVLNTRGKEVRLAKGSILRVRLAEPVTVRVKG